MTSYPSILVADHRGRQIPFPSFIGGDNLAIIRRDFDRRADDIFVTTFPRAGTTWTEQIVHLLLNGGEQTEQRITDAVPWLETLPDRSADVPGFLAALPRPRRFTSHLPLSFMFDGQVDTGRFIYVARNPKDVAVSYYYHDRSKAGYEGSWEEHFALFMAGELSFGGYFDHVLPWWEASRTHDNILFLKYEAMKADLPGAVRQIADFLKLDPGAGVVDRVVAGSTFKAMKNNNQTNLEWLSLKEGEPKHIRKGIVGDWRGHFSAAQNRQLDAVYADRMAGTGLTFDFGPD